MLAAAALLAALAVALAWPVPVVLARARWTDAAPGTALVLWQAIALAGVLSLLGALLTAGLAPFGDHLVAATRVLAVDVVAGTVPPGATLPALAGVTAALLIGLHLALNLVVTAARVQRQRQRHLDLLVLLSTPLPDAPRTRLLDTPAPVAYCLPGSTRSVTVLSAGLLDLLSPQEVEGVIAHERAHLVQHHALVLTAFRAWRIALPWFPVADRAQDAVGVLVEMLADDRARRAVPAPALAHAIGAVAAGGEAGSPVVERDSRSPAADRASVDRRVARLLHPPAPPTRALRRAVLAGSAALVVVPAVLLVAPAFGG